MGSRKELLINDAGTYYANIYSSNTLALVKKQVTDTFPTTETQKIIASDRGSGDKFGTSVFIDGNYIIVGTKDSTGNSPKGAAYIYKRNSSTGVWGDEQKIEASDKQAGDNFGDCVSISGDYAIVGASREDTGGNSAGAAYIYKRNSSTGVWGDEQKIQASDKQADDWFGFRVSISGDYAIVGSMYEDTGVSGAGAAYIYKRNTSTGQWGDEKKIQASDKELNDWFGMTVGISGDYVVIGAQYEDTSGSGAGSAYIYKRNVSTGEWGDEQKIQSSDIQPGDLFGNNVSISGDYVIASAILEDTGGSAAGAAYIYKRNASTGVWEQQAKIQASDKQTEDRFGRSLHINGDYAIVGAFKEDTGATDAGAAYIYKRTGSNWEQQSKIQASDAQSEDHFGYSVGISGRYAIVGAWQEDEDTSGGNTLNSAGSSYIFERPPDIGPKSTITPTYGGTQEIVSPHSGGVSETVVSTNASGAQSLINKLSNGVLTIPDNITWSTSVNLDDTKIFYTFPYWTKIDKWQIWDARRDWTFTEYHVWFGSSTTDLTKYATYSFNPTSQWDGGTPNNQIQTLSSGLEQACKVMAFSFTDPTTNPNNSNATIAGVGVNEIKIWGYQSATSASSLVLTFPKLDFDGYNKLTRTRPRSVVYGDASFGLG